MILDNTFPPDPRVENEAISLINAGHEVILYCFSFDKNQVQSERIKGIQVERHFIAPFIFKFSALAYTLSLYHRYLRKSLSAFIRKHAVEALHIHDMQVARAVFEVNQQFKLPVVLDLHENRPEIMKHYTHVQDFPGRWLINPERWKKYEFQFIARADATIVVTEEAREYYLQNMADSSAKFYVVPNTVRRSFYEEGKINPELNSRFKDHFTLLYMGDTGLRRGLETVLDAMASLKDRIINIKLVVVGENRTDHLLKDKVKSLGLQNHVDFEGWRPFSTFPAYVNAADVGLCPFHRNIHHDTTYANKLFQFLSWGKPVVVSDCQAQANLINTYHCGLVFHDRDAADLAEKLMILYNDPSLYQSMSKKAKDMITQHYNWERTSEPLIQLYARL